jgi:hypothetical protein
MSVTPDDIKQVFESMLGAFAKESLDAYQAVASNEIVANAVEAAKKGDYQMFRFGLCHPLEQVVDGLLADVTHSQEARFILKHSRFVESHFRYLIEKREGAACCADKSRTIMRVLLRFYMTGEEIRFNFDQDFTYHLPGTVFTTHSDIVAYFVGVYCLYYGRPEAYLKAMTDMLQYVPGAGSA